LRLLMIIRAGIIGADHRGERRPVTQIGTPSHGSGAGTQIWAPDLPE
jgi:hypothetical protein